jgi:hypothetical protein
MSDEGRGNKENGELHRKYILLFFLHEDVALVGESLKIVC